MEPDQIPLRTRMIKFYPTKIQQQTLNKWFGCCRYLYNDVLNRINHKTKKNFQTLRNIYVTETSKKYTDIVHHYEKWMYETPKEIRAQVMKELATNINTNIAKKASFKMKFRSKKKDIQQTISIPSTAIKLKENKLSLYPKLLGEIKIHKKEMNKLKSIETEIKIIRIKPNIWILGIPYKYENKNNENIHKKICAIDPGVKTFLTGVGTDGMTFKIGDNCINNLMKQQEKTDKIKSKLENLKDTKDRLGYLRTKNSLYLSLYKSKNMLIEIHNQAINFLVKHYDIILIPKLKMKTDRKKLNRKILLFSHCHFIDKLKNKCKMLGKKVIIVKEHYTSKTCYNCGTYNKPEINRIYNCARCKITIDRDVNGAINIFQKSIIEHSCTT